VTVPGALSAAAVARFQMNGYLFPIRVLSAEEAGDYWRRFEAFEAEMARRHGYSLEELHHKAYRFKPHLLLRWLDDLVRRPAILDVVEALIGPDILVWSSAFFVKNAHDPGYLAWHQDAPTYGLTGADLVTAWVALTDSSAENAAMRVLPGTHRLGLLPHRETFAEHNRASRGETVELEVDERQAVTVTLAAGEMSLHHLFTVHGSPPNAAPRRRIGYAIRYMPPAVRPVAGPASALLVRGEDHDRHFEPEPPPAADWDPAAVAVYERAMRLRSAAVFGEAPTARAIQ
jgi:non-haem Fe2+, alpha-ketoglutarate-dependent halogenase